MAAPGPLWSYGANLGLAMNNAANLGRLQGIPAAEYYSVLQWQFRLVRLAALPGGKPFSRTIKTTSSIGNQSEDFGLSTS